MCLYVFFGMIIQFDGLVRILGCQRQERESTTSGTHLHIYQSRCSMLSLARGRLVH